MVQIRACIFDLDGLLINSETLLSEARNATLASYSRPPMDGAVKAKLQGRSALDSTRILYESARFPLLEKGEATVTIEEFQRNLDDRLREVFRSTEAMTGAERLLGNLARATTMTMTSGRKGEKSEEGEDSEDSKGGKRTKDKGMGTRVELALATSSQMGIYRLKTAHLSGPGAMLSRIPREHKVLGDDKGLKKGRGKPFPDIFLLALERVNETVVRNKGETEIIKPEECLVFEDAVAGVEAARRAGMNVVWVPEAWLRHMYAGREGEVIDGRTGEGLDWKGRGERDTSEGAGGSAGTGGNGRGEVLSSLEEFEYEKYGIVVGDEK